MMPQYHVIYGAIFSAALFIFTPINLWQAGLIFFTSVFIDLDHAIRYTIKTGNLNPIKFWKWSIFRYKKWKKIDVKKHKIPFFALHGVEFIAILAFLSIFTSWAKYLLIGALFHLILDYIHLVKSRRPLASKISQLWVLVRNKNKKSFD